MKALRNLRLVLVACLAATIAAPPPAAAQSTPGEWAEPTPPHVLHPLVDQELRSADGPIAVALTWSLPTENDPDYAAHPAWETGVNPVLYDLVLAAEPGARLEPAEGSFVTVQARLAPEALVHLLGNPYLVSVEPGTPAPTTGEVVPDRVQTKATCSPTTYRWCTASGRFGISATVGGSSRPRSCAYSTGNATSVVFRSPGSGPGEVLAKVLDACSFNSKFWVFAAKATSSSYAVTVTDYSTSTSKIYVNSCPVTDTAAFDC